VEAQAVARLQHPNIVQVYHLGEQDGRLYFAMELVEGGTLSRHLGGKPLPNRVAAQLVETLARAMHHAHQKDIIHRDLKPANILLASGGREAHPAAHAAGSPAGSRSPLAELTP